MTQPKTLKTSEDMHGFCLCYARADRSVRAVIQNALEGLGLTFMEWLLIGTLHKGPKEGMSMTAVAQSLKVTLPQVTVLATRLADNDLVRQRMNYRDRRSRRMTATPKGQEMLVKVDDSIQPVLEDMLQEIPRKQWDGFFNAMCALGNKADSDIIKA